MRNKYEIVEDKVKIYLTTGADGEKLFTWISLKQFDRVNEYKGTWRAQYNHTSRSYYVIGQIWKNGKNKKIYMHRWIMKPDKDQLVDHINNDTLDNTEENLRIANRFENMQNRKGAQTDSKTGIRGVSWNNQRKKWVARVTVNRKVYQKYCNSIEEAELWVIETRAKYMPFSKEALERKDLVMV
jgi:hypothetical protein